MRAEQISSNVVIVARHFNPSILDRHWAITNGILSENDFEQGCIFTPVLSQINARDFKLLITPDQLQLVPSDFSHEAGAIILSKVGAIVERLPHTPYVAIGLNFIWHIIPTDEGMRALSRRLFFKEDNPIYQSFDTDNALFGAYLSKNYLNSRLKLDIKPATIMHEGQLSELLQFSFNFHRDIVDQRVENILELLRNWSQAKDFTTEFITNLLNRSNS